MLPLSVVIAPDSFKGSASAADAAAAIADGWRSVRPDDAITQIPQADGGEGTLDAMARGIASARFHKTTVHGPDGRPVPARWLELPHGVAVVELAESSGLPLMASLDPLGASSAGVGESMRAALAHGAREIVLGLGGSASTDGGMGALSALGLRLLDDEGNDLPPGGGALHRLASVDASALIAPPVNGMRILTDVDNPLLGPRGAAAIFAPQKGADAADIERLERGLTRLAEVLGGSPGFPGAGAAGGTAYGFATLWGARVEPGAAVIAELSGLAAATSGADVLILGEGRFDATSLGGKVVGSALALAGPNTRVVIVAGRVDAVPVLPDGRRAETVALVDLAGGAEAAQTYALRWLREAGAEAARGRATRG